LKKDDPLLKSKLSAAYLEKRYHNEKKFHDQWARDIKVEALLVNESFEAETAIENRAALKEFGALRAMKILDLGCGAGEAAVYFAAKGADAYAVDISDEMLKKTKELSVRHKVDLKICNMKSEVLDFENNFFDFVFGNGVLHHSDVESALSETARVLKKEGKAVFIEPLGYNPFIHLYRKLAKAVRTDNEAPFRYHDLDCAKEYFSSVQYKYFWLSSLVIFMFMYFVERIDPSRERYWKRIIKESDKYERIFKFFNRLDIFLLKIFPFLGIFCWNIMVILKDKRD